MSFWEFLLNLNDRVLMLMIVFGSITTIFCAFFVMHTITTVKQGEDQ